MFFSNPRSLCNKIGLLNAKLIELNSDLFLINESWLYSEIPNNFIASDYEIHRKDRDSRGGGVLIGVKKHIKSLSIDIFPELESISIEIIIRNKKILFSTIYLPPNKIKNAETFEILSKNLKKIETFEKYDNIFIIGDLNINFNFSNTDSFALKIRDLFLKYGFSQYVKQKTYKYSENILDLIFCNNKCFENLEIIENISHICDHKAIKFEIPLMKTNYINEQKIFRYDFNEKNLTILNDRLFGTDWENICTDSHDINDIYSKIEKTYENILKNYIPLKIVKNNVKNKFPKSINKLILKRRIISKKIKMNPNFIVKYDYLTKLIANEIENYENTKMSKIIDNSNNLYDLYKYLKVFSKETKCNSFLDENSINITDNRHIIEKFREYFLSNYSKIRNKYTFDFNDSNNRLPEISVSMNDILNAFKTFKFNKSEGNTFITNRVIKNCLNGSTKLLFFLFNKIISLEKFPQKLLISKLTPILKKGKNKHKFDSYRGVSVQSNLLRLFELILLNKLYPFIIENHLIPPQQYGYQKSISISSQHIDIQNIIFKGLNEKDVICIDIIFLDLSNAFDCIPHKKLIDFINSKGISGSYLKLISDSLMNRKQFVKYNDTYSISDYVNSGVAQGGVLSPVQYNLYVSDLPNYLKCSNFQWADDTVILSVIKSTDDSVKLQNDLNSFEKYCNEKNLIINETKTKHLRICLKKYDFCYKLKNKVIETIDSHKHLGVIYDSKMKFNLHCNEIYQKCFSKFNFLKFVAKKVDGKTFLKLYKTYILPLIEYSNACWVPNSTQLKTVEKIQKKISKYICYKLGKNEFNYEQRLNFLNIKSIESRRKISALKLVFDVKSKSPKIPINWFDHFVFQNTRNGIKLKTDFKRIDLIDKKYFNYCIKLFNLLPFNIRNECNFKFYLNFLTDFLK